MKRRLNPPDPKETVQSKQSKRQPKATSAQIDHLVDYMVEHPHVSGNKFMGIHGSATLKGNWQELMEQLNEMGVAGKTKDLKSWKITWRDTKTAACAKATKIRQHRVKTGNTGGHPPVLTEREKKILSILGKEYVQGSNCPDAFPEEPLTRDELLPDESTSRQSAILFDANQSDENNSLNPMAPSASRVSPLLLENTDFNDNADLMELHPSSSNQTRNQQLVDSQETHFSPSAHSAGLDDRDGATSNEILEDRANYDSNRMHTEDNQFHDDIVDDFEVPQPRIGVNSGSEHRQTTPQGDIRHRPPNHDTDQIHMEDHRINEELVDDPRVPEREIGVNSGSRHRRTIPQGGIRHRLHMGAQLMEARTAFADIADRQVRCMERFAEAMQRMASADEERNDIMRRLMENDRIREENQQCLLLLVEKILAVFQNR